MSRWTFRPFFTQISGRKFLPELCGEVDPGTAPLQALRCALCSTEQSTFRGGAKGEKVPRKRGEKGWPAKGAKRKKERMKTGQHWFEAQGASSPQDGNLKEIAKKIWTFKAKILASKAPTQTLRALFSDGVKRHLSRRHLGALNFQFLCTPNPRSSRTCNFEISITGAVTRHGVINWEEVGEKFW